MLIWTESYESVTNTGNIAVKYNAVGSNNSATTMTVTGTHRTGSNAGNTVGTHIIDLVGTDQDDLLIVGHARYLSNPSLTSGAPGETLLALKGDAGATTHITLTVDSSGTLRVYRGTTAGTLLATATAAVSLTGTQLWYHFEVKVRLSDTVGTVEVRLDGTTVTALTLTGADTKNGGTNTVFDRVELASSVLQDDVTICNEQGSDNTDFIGPVHVEHRVPNGNGATSNGVGSDGNSTDNYLLVDEAFTNNQSSWGSDYVDLASTGDKDTYAYTDSTFPTGNSVKGVMVWTHAQKTDAGVRTVQPVARLSGTETNGAACTLLNGSYRTLGAVFETKPGGGAWTVGDVNSAEFGPLAST